jgi:SAM-dependent methyltransferase
MAMSYRLAFDMIDDATGERHSLLLSGGLWYGDTFLYDFAFPRHGLAGRIECDWRTGGPTFHLDQGDSTDPASRDALGRVAQLLRPFFTGTFIGWNDEQLAALYPGTYHEQSGYTQPEPSAFEAEFKGAIADMVVRTLQPRKVLDAGCAGGLLVRELHRRGVAAFGFDHCPDLARIALPEVAPVLRRGSVTAIPFTRDDGFDTLVCIDVFEHVPEDRVPQMVAEFTRLGVRHLAVHIVHTELEHFGHITLRPLSWWDQQLAPGFRRAQTTGGPLLALPCPYDPRRVLRIYQQVESPIVLSRPAAGVSGTDRSRSAPTAPAATAPR